MVSPYHSCLCSYIHSREISFTHEDFHIILSFLFGLFYSPFLANIDINWVSIDLGLKYSKLKYYLPSTSSLNHDAYEVEDILRNNVITNVGDHIHMAPLIFIINYFIIDMI